MAASDLRRQFLAENSQLLSFWRANVRREVSTDGGSPPLWGKKNQLRKLAGGQPGETAAIANSTEGQAPVAVKTVPAQVGGLERFAAHGLHWVPEEGLYFTNLDRHVRGRPLNTGELRSSNTLRLHLLHPLVGHRRVDGGSQTIPYQVRARPRPSRVDWWGQLQ